MQRAHPRFLRHHGGLKFLLRQSRLDGRGAAGRARRRDLAVSSLVMPASVASVRHRFPLRVRVFIRWQGDQSPDSLSSPIRSCIASVQSTDVVRRRRASTDAAATVATRDGSCSGSFVPQVCFGRSSLLRSTPCGFIVSFRSPVKNETKRFVPPPERTERTGRTGHPGAQNRHGFDGLPSPVDCQFPRRRRAARLRPASGPAASRASDRRAIPSRTLQLSPIGS